MTLRMMMMPMWAPTRLISRVVMIRTEPVGPIPLTGIRSATIGNAKRVGVWRPTNAKKEEDRHKGKVVLSLFRDSPKEGALTYTDWCREVEEYIRKGYDDNQIKDAMLSSVEGQAYVNFRSCDEGRNCTLRRKSSKRWTVSIMFRSHSGT